MLPGGDPIAQPVPGTFTVRPPPPGSASTAPTQLRTGPPSVRRAVLRFMASSLIAIVVLAVATVYVQRRLGEEAAIRSARESGALIGRGIVQPVLTEASLAGPGPARTLLDSVVRARVLDHDIVRVKIWVAGRDDPLLRRAAADREHVHPRRGRRRRPRVGRDRRRHQRPVQAGEPVRAREWTSTRGLPSGHGDADRADPSCSSCTSGSTRRASAALASGASRRSRCSRRSRWCGCSRSRSRGSWRGGSGPATRNASGSSSAPSTRRTSNGGGSRPTSTTASSRSSPAPRTCSARRASAPPRHRCSETESALAESAGAVRGAIQQLRSLIVDIHPPNLETVGLDGALEELAAGVPGSALEVNVDVEPDLARRSGRRAPAVPRRAGGAAQRRRPRRTRRARTSSSPPTRAGRCWSRPTTASGSRPTTWRSDATRDTSASACSPSWSADAGGSLEIDSRPGGPARPCDCGCRGS